MTQSIQWAELEQEPYDPEEFVERLAWRALGSSAGASATASTNPFENDLDGEADVGAEDFDAQQLNDSFVQSIKDLTLMLEKQQKKCQNLEQVISIFENKFLQER